MKKTVFALLISILLCLCACGNDSAAEENSNAVRIAALKGPTSMGMVKLFDDSDNGLTSNNYEYNIFGSVDEISPKLLSGSLDIVSVPANLGSVLYNKSSGKIKALAVNTLGVLYIVDNGRENINSLADLRGKTILATGKGQTPEIVLKYLLSENGLTINEDVNIIWKSEASEVVAAFETNEYSIAMLPQPYIAAALKQYNNMRIAIDLNSEWEKFNNNSRFTTSVILVRDEFLKNNSDAVNTFINDLGNSVKFVNENIDEAANLIEKYNIVKAPIAKDAIPYCNIVCIIGSEMKADLEGYLKVLKESDAKTIGGKMPGEDFYIINE